MDIGISELKIELDEFDKALDDYDRRGLRANNSSEVRSLIAKYELEWKNRIEDWEYEFFIISDDDYEYARENGNIRKYISTLDRIEYWRDYFPSLILSVIKSYRNFLYWERII